jgi:hypothetical protein
MMVALANLAGGDTLDYALDSMPASYNIIAYDDCGVPERQPHVRAEGIYTFPPSQLTGGARVRSVAWAWKEITVAYDGLKPEVPYIVAVTYANEAFNDRVQSLYAGDVCLHGPRPLPKGGSERLLFRIPTEAVRNGTLELRFKLEGQVNVVVSAVELWAPLPSPKTLRIADVSALWKDLEGEILNLRWDPVPGASVSVLSGKDGTPLATTETDAAGHFVVPRDAFEMRTGGEGVEVIAKAADMEARRSVSEEDLTFEPIRYRPLPTSVAGVRRPVIRLDGVWRMQAGDPEEARLTPLDSPLWKPFRVPGQWLQQGLDTPPDRPVSVGTEFTVPVEWKGRRVILRFDAVHAGTRYWVNGHELGRTEHLFTPVEWDVTEHVVCGSPNRLDMEMVVQTESERLAHASGYAFHNLGGIPRSVRLFALPQTHLRSLSIHAGLINGYRDGTFTVGTEIAGSDTEKATLRVKVAGAEIAFVGQMPAPSSRKHTLTCVVPRVRPWTPESPNLYEAVIELRVGGRVVERVTRKIGFRAVEVRGSELLVNGKRVKLAGACHHETYPLTGRADTARWAETDVRLMKEANLNYVRTSHYPPTEEFLEECDRQGMFAEVEAPFCWVGDEGFSSLRAILTPTSAMVDYSHWHPSVIIWSLANESTFNPCFEVSNRLVKDLDPTRPTTFNNPDPKRICDIANVHYPPMPFDEYDRDDPRPLLLGEYFFPVCHEQTDVRRNPGLRELWGAGHSDPESDFGRACAREFGQPYAQPGEPPGAWTHIIRSRRVVGGCIWAALDEPFYLPGGKRAGYAWVHGFWGLIDGWRRPKPEHWLARQIFSPVWFPVRRLPSTLGSKAVTIPVENRFASTDLSELTFDVRCRDRHVTLRTSVPPFGATSLTVPLPPDAATGDTIIIEPRDRSGRTIVTATVWLGGPLFPPIPGDVAPREEQAAAMLFAPAFHATRFDFGDLWPGQPPFEVLPSPPVQRSVRTERNGDMTVTTYAERSADFEGEVVVTQNPSGPAHLSYNMVRTGPDFHAREIGIRIPVPGHDWTLSWERWSEWGDAPPHSIMRVRGSARPWRGSRPSRIPENVRPRWPWDTDETEEGTTDFRSVKFHILRASLLDPKGCGITVYGNADIHVRAAVEGNETAFYLLTRCGLAPVLVRRGDRLQGTFVVHVSGAR